MSAPTIGGKPCETCEEFADRIRTSTNPVRCDADRDAWALHLALEPHDEQDSDEQ